MWNDKCESRRRAAIFTAPALGTVEGAEVRALWFGSCCVALLAGEDVGAVELS